MAKEHEEGKMALSTVLTAKHLLAFARAKVDLSVSVAYTANGPVYYSEMMWRK
jgi:hypothetical protein